MSKETTTVIITIIILILLVGLTLYRFLPTLIALAANPIFILIALLLILFLIYLLFKIILFAVNKIL